MARLSLNGPTMKSRGNAALSVLRRQTSKGEAQETESRFAKPWSEVRS